MAIQMADEQYLNVEEAAERLRASPYTIRKWLRSGRMKGVQIGGRKLGWRIPVEEVTRLLREGRRQPGSVE